MSRMAEQLLCRAYDPDTSREAAIRVASHLSEIQEKVLVFLKGCPSGATDLDISRHFEDDRSTYRSRRAELGGRSRLQGDRDVGTSHRRSRAPGRRP